LHPLCFHFASCFVVEIASTCWWLIIITCWFASTKPPMESAKVHKIPGAYNTSCMSLKIGLLWHHRWCSRCNLKYNESTCDWRHMSVSGDILLPLELHISDVHCD
jgi:hypothetical protein